MKSKTTKPPSPPSTRGTTQRALRSNRGLFDTGTTGKAGFFPVDINTPDVFKVISASNLFTKSDLDGTTADLDDPISIPLDGTGLESLGNDVPLAVDDGNHVTLVEGFPLVSSGVSTELKPDKDSNIAGMEADFLEGFCDLSSFLNGNEGGTESLPDMMEISCLDSQIEDFERLLRKRTAEDAFVEPVPVKAMPTVTTVPSSSPSKNISAIPSKNIRAPSKNNPAPRNNISTILSKNTSHITTISATPSIIIDPNTLVDTDHGAYTCNAKRARVTSATSRLSSTSSETTDLDTSTNSEPSTSKSSSKYAERRRKNNIASRRSRQTRKQKFASMEQRAEELSVTNDRLEQQVVELENLTKIMKKILVGKLSMHNTQ